ncbi:DUF11 domain-containing protein [Leucobacter triazinivorans]|uniref:DUF11 domain-containing protein n=1 Tax=Leucobacter triazinivorans TaxID=1784719 RepID=A0A4V0Z1H3_9MICO|nr:DUF11 domain-containing protein [Leucobacter triazinivorans]QBE48409.1 DUF11 domain-containing protein [Leucobacter triazinivorans]
MRKSSAPGTTRARRSGWGRATTVLLSAVSAGAAGALVIGMLPVLATSVSSRAADGAAPPETWDRADIAVTGALASQGGLPGTSGPVEYAWGVDYAGDASRPGAAITGQELPDARINVLEGDALTGSAAAWPGADGADAAAVGAEVAAGDEQSAPDVVGSPAPNLEGALTTLSQRVTEAGVGNTRWRIREARAAEVNTDGGPSRLQIDGADGAVQVFVTDPRLSLALEACVSVSACDVDDDGDWRPALEVAAPHDGAAAERMTWRATAVNAGNVELADVRLVTATADAAPLEGVELPAFGTIAVGQSAVATFTTPVAFDGVSRTVVATASAIFSGTGPDGADLVQRFTDAAGSPGRVPSNEAAATLAAGAAETPRVDSPDSEEPAQTAPPEGEASGRDLGAPRAADPPQLVLEHRLVTPTDAGPLPNGSQLQGAVYLSVNSPTGAHGEHENLQLTLEAANGVFRHLPGVCLTDVEPASEIVDGGTSVVCSLGRVDWGAALRVDYAVEVALTATSGTVTVVAGSEGEQGAVEAQATAPSTTYDLVFDPFVPSTVLPQTKTLPERAVGFPFGLRVGAHTVLPDGPITFDVQVDSDDIDDAASLIQLGSDCRADAAFSDQSELSALPAFDARLASQACTVAPLGSGAFRVTVSEYHIPPLVRPTKAGNGAALPNEAYTLIALGFLTVHAPEQLSGAGELLLTAGNLTSGGEPVDDADPASDQQRIRLDPLGTHYQEIDGLNLVDGSWIDMGLRWSIDKKATAGQHIRHRMVSTYFQNLAPAEIRDTPSQGVQRFRSAIRLSVNYDGYLQVPPEYLGQGVEVEVYTSPLPSYPKTSFPEVTPGPGTSAPHNPATQPCARPTTDASVWTQQTLTPNEVDPSGGTFRISGDAASWQSVVVSYDFSNATMPVIRSQVEAGLGLMPGLSGQSLAYATSSISNGVAGEWAYGDWRGKVTDNGTAYSGVYPKVVDFFRQKPYIAEVTKEISPSAAAPGDVVTVITRPYARNFAGGTAYINPMSVDEILPEGLSWVPGSFRVAVEGKPISTPPNPSHPSSFWWQAGMYQNTETVMSYQAVVTATEGVLTTSSSFRENWLGSPVLAESSATLRVKQNTKTVLLKQAGAAEVPAGLGSNTWKITLTNNDVLPQSSTDIIDLLPYNGDPRGSSFSGTFAVHSVTLNPGETLYCSSAAPQTISVDPLDPANADPGDGLWQSCSPTQVPEGTTALRIVGGALAAKKSKTVTLTWSLQGEQVGDTYYNFSAARASGTGLAMLSGDLVTVVRDGSALQVHAQFVSATGWRAGDELTWQIQVKNSSPKPAYQVVVGDVPDAGLVAGEVTWGAPPAGTAVVGGAWALGTVPAGQTRSIQVKTPLARDAEPDLDFLNAVTVSNPSSPYDSARPVADIQRNDTVDADTDQSDVGVARAPLAAFQIDKVGESGNCVPPASSCWVAMAGSDWRVYPVRGGVLDESQPIWLSLAPVDGVSPGAGAPGTATRFIVSRLVPGDYALVEHVAPAGFSLLAAPLRFSVSVTGVLTFDASDIAAETVEISDASTQDFGTIPRATVRDVPNMVFPVAGGAGSGLVGWSAALLLAAGGMLLVRTLAARRRSLRGGI